MLSENYTINFPNADSYLGNYTTCPKEVLQKAWTDKVGKTLEVCGVLMRVVNVRIDEKFMFVDLEKIKE